MAYAPKYRTPSEFGGVPGPWGNTDAGEPLTPELAQRALYQTPGGRDAFVGFDSKTDFTVVPGAPSHGNGGARQVTELL